jgi:hypothetical protein
VRIHIAIWLELNCSQNGILFLNFHIDLTQANQTKLIKFITYVSSIQKPPSKLVSMKPMHEKVLLILNLLIWNTTHYLKMDIHRISVAWSWNVHIIDMWLGTFLMEPSIDSLHQNSTLKLSNLLQQSSHYFESNSNSNNHPQHTHINLKKNVNNENNSSTQ